MGGYDPAKLDMARLNSAFDAEVKAGAYPLLVPRGIRQEPIWDAGCTVAASNQITYIILMRGTALVRSLELQARKSLLSLYLFTRQPGQDLTIEYVAPECGVRETATIRGEAR